MHRVLIFRTLGCVAAALLATLAATSAPAVAAPNWTTYTPDGGGYSIDMPGDPNVTSGPVKTAAGTVTTTVAGIDGGTKAYLSVYAIFPEAAFAGRSAQSILDGSEAGAVKNSGGMLRKDERLTIGPYPARNFIVDVPGGRVLIDRIVLKGNSQIQAIVVGDKTIETAPDTIRFFTSLKVPAP